MLRKNAGFTLIELMIVITVIGILVTIAYPTYSEFLVKNKVADGTAQLNELRLRMEQYYQDNRAYNTASTTTCGIANFNGTYFSYSCTAPNATTYVWTASNLTNQGLGAAGDYAYTIDQDGSRATTAFSGAASTSTCWNYAAGQCI